MFAWFFSNEKAKKLLLVFYSLTRRRYPKVHWPTPTRNITPRKVQIQKISNFWKSKSGGFLLLQRVWTAI